MFSYSARSFARTECGVTIEIRPMVAPARYRSAMVRPAIATSTPLSKPVGGRRGEGRAGGARAPGGAARGGRDAERAGAGGRGRRAEALVGGRPGAGGRGRRHGRGGGTGGGAAGGGGVPRADARGRPAA